MKEVKDAYIFLLNIKLAKEYVATASSGDKKMGA
jgi:hypothetical protein